jgi:hypothetical protein
MKLREREKGEEIDRASVISHTRDVMIEDIRM